MARPPAKMNHDEPEVVLPLVVVSADMISHEDTDCTDYCMLQPLYHIACNRCRWESSEQRASFS